MTLSSIRRVTRERDKESALSQFSRKLPEIPDAAFQQQRNAIQCRAEHHFEGQKRYFSDN